MGKKLGRAKGGPYSGLVCFVRRSDTGSPQYFHSVFGKPTNNTINSNVADPRPDLISATITVDQVNDIVQKLDVNKSCGTDDISPILLKCFPHYLSPSLCYLFLSIFTGWCTAE